VLLLLLLVAMLAGARLFYSTPIGRSLRTAVYRPFSPNFPYLRKDFVGREDDAKKLMELLDFSDTQYNIVNVIGPPGIGKSTLAIFIGNEMIVNGAIVHYVNMAEFPEGHLKQVLAERMLAVENVTFDKLLRWASNKYWKNLIVLDNCDECINEQKEAFQEAITEILHSSDSIKILMTSREVVYFFENCYEHQVKPLSERAACSILHRKVPSILNEAETKRIVELTDAIPLALQIVGSLLGIKVAPPTPRDIIIELEKHPIPTLSNPELSMTMQRSINLSYKYLSSRLQIISMYIAFFPGSFTKASFIDQFVQLSADYLSQSLDKLVMRSLLEFDEYSGRYHFHRLIKEFFLLQTEDFEDYFHVDFHKHYSSHLCTLTDMYFESPKHALAILDRERHNFLHFLATIPRYSLLNFRESVHCLYLSLKGKYLSIRISPDQLIAPVKFITDYISVMGGLIFPPKLDVDFKHYVFFVGYLSNLIEESKQAFEVLNFAVRVVELFDKMISTGSPTETSLLPRANEHYINFYTNFLLKFESELDEDTTQLFYERILKKTNESTLNCVVGHCKYHQIGDTFFSLGEYEKSVTFYEKSVDTEEFNELHTIAKVNHLLVLRIAYIHLGNTASIPKVNTKLLEEFPTVINQPSSLVYSYIFVYEDYVNFLSTVSYSKYIDVLKKLYNAFFELGKNDDYGSPRRALDLAQVLYKHGVYVEALEVSSCGLETLDAVNESMTHERIGLLMISWKSNSYLDNYDRADDLSVKTIDFLIASNLTVPYTMDFTECCSYLVSVGNVDRVSVCFPIILQKVYEYFKPYIEVAVFVIFGMPLRVIEENNSLPEKSKPDLPIEQYPEVIQHSRSKELLFDSRRDVSQQWMYENPIHVFFNSETILMFLKHHLYNILSYGPVRFFLNFLSIFGRFILLYCGLHLLLRCIKLLCFIIFMCTESALSLIVIGSFACCCTSFIT
jgi:tetratricopeptide (TPR) repeat protein